MDGYSSSLKQTLKLPVLAFYLALSRRWPRRVPPPPDPEGIRKVLLLQFGGIGDSLRMFPLIRMLGEAFPTAGLSTLTNQSPHLFDLIPQEVPACRHLAFDFRHGLLAKWRRLRELRRERFDLIVLPIAGDGFVEIAVLARLIGARCIAGFDLDGGGLIFTNSIPLRRDESILGQYGRLLNAIGAGGSADNIPMRRDRGAATSVTNRLKALGLADKPVVVVHPWVAHHEGFRAWPAASYRELIARLIADLDVAVVIVGSTAEQEMAGKHFADLESARVVNLTGRLTFAETTALVGESNCLVCNDSCMIMVADALRVPSVAIFGSTTPAQVLAVESLCRPVLTHEPLPCQPCYVHQTLFAYRCAREFKCLTTVSVKQVLQAITETLAESRADLRRLTPS